MLLTPAQIKPLSFESRRNSFSTRGGCASSVFQYGVRLGRQVTSTVLSLSTETSVSYLDHHHQSKPPVSVGWVSNNVTVRPKLQALVYDILPSTTDVFSYAIGSRKLSQNRAGQLRGDKECPFSDVTKSGRVWSRKVPESDARSVSPAHTPSIAFRHLPPRKDVVNQCLLRLGRTRCRKPVLGVWVRPPLGRRRVATEATDE